MAQTIENQQAIFVLGMHRSGTSAMARVLNLMGVDLGIKTEDTGKDNQRGFWENPELVSINEDILKAIHSSWQDLRSLPDQWWKTDIMTPFILRIERIMDQQFSQSLVWGLKDPRVCRLLPLWLHVLKQNKCSPSFVCITRHPMEVMRSLKTRNKFSSWKGYLLWLKYTLEAERESRGYPRVFVTYEDLLNNHTAVIEKISSSISLPLPENREELFMRANDFLSADLRHERADNTSLSKADPLHKLINQAYLALTKTTNHNENELSTHLDQVRTSWEALEPDILPLIEENEALMIEAINHERSKRFSKRFSKKLKRLFGINK